MLAFGIAKDERRVVVIEDDRDRLGKRSRYLGQRRGKDQAQRQDKSKNCRTEAGPALHGRLTS